MSHYTCDICSKATQRSEVTFHDVTTMRRAIRDGLNPWRTPGIDMRFNTVVGAALGLGWDEQYHAWRDLALAFTTDWGLCPRCTQAIGELLGPVPARVGPSPGRDYAACLLAALGSAAPHVSAGVAEFAAQIASDPDTTDKCFWLGEAYLMAAGGTKNMASLDQAIGFFQRALQFDPSHKDSYAKLFGAYMSKGDDGGARETATRWAEVDPNLSVTARRWLQEQGATPHAGPATATEAHRLAPVKRWWHFWR